MGEANEQQARAETDDARPQRKFADMALNGFRGALSLLGKVLELAHDKVIFPLANPTAYKEKREQEEREREFIRQAAQREAQRKRDFDPAEEERQRGIREGYGGASYGQSEPIRTRPGHKRFRFGDSLDEIKEDRELAAPITENPPQATAEAEGNAVQGAGSGVKNVLPESGNASPNAGLSKEERAAKRAAEAAERDARRPDMLKRYDEMTAGRRERDKNPYTLSPEQMAAHAIEMKSLLAGIENFQKNKQGPTTLTKERGYSPGNPLGR